jgi:FkbM family methyltransferase
MPARPTARHGQHSVTILHISPCTPPVVRTGPAPPAVKLSIRGPLRFVNFAVSSVSNDDDATSNSGLGTSARLRRTAAAGKLKEVVDVLATPGGIRAFARWKPFSVTAFHMLRALRALDVQPRTIVDAGANLGQFARAAAESFPGARIIAFEPLPEVAEAMRRNLRDRPHVRVRAEALGPEDGTVHFHRNEYSQASSVLSLRAEAAASYNLRERDLVDVPVVRLDTALRGETLDPPVLLKLDLQGYELEALRGAEETLARTDHVLVEVALQPMYEGQPTLEELVSFLDAAGFRFLSPVAFLRDRGRITQMDVVFESVRSSR